MINNNKLYSQFIELNFKTIRKAKLIMGDCCSTGKRHDNDDEDIIKIIKVRVDKSLNKKSDCNYLQDNNNINLITSSAQLKSYNSLRQLNDHINTFVINDGSGSKETARENLQNKFRTKLIDNKLLDRSCEDLGSIHLIDSKTRREETEHLSHFMDNTIDVFT